MQLVSVIKQNILKEIKFLVFPIQFILSFYDHMKISSNMIKGESQEDTSNYLYKICKSEILFLKS